MLLGKRPRQPMKRTTSMSEITFDLNTTTINQEATPHNDIFTQNHVLVSYGGQIDQRFLSNAAPSRPNRRASADFLETPHFLRSCFLCRRKLVPGRDIYMYRGDSAFCSYECRQQQMNQDERNDKCSIASKKDVSSSAAASKVSSKGETVAAV